MGVKLQIFSIVTSLLLTTIGLVAVIFGNGFIKSFVSSVSYSFNHFEKPLLIN